MRVVTCVSDVSHPGYQYFLQASCEYHELELITLVHEGTWSSHRIKDAYLRKYLDTLPRGEIVLFTDGYDAMFVASEEEILEKYQAFHRPLVFTAERNCWPDESLSGLFPDSPTRHRYLNCGGFVGEAGAIIDLLDARMAKPLSRAEVVRSAGRPDVAEMGDVPAQNLGMPLEHSNQYLWVLQFLRDPELFALDYQADIFLTLETDITMLHRRQQQWREPGDDSSLYAEERQRLADECRMVGGRVHYTPTGARPCQIHFNGTIAKDLAFKGQFVDAMPWVEDL